MQKYIAGNFDPNKFDNLLVVNYWIKNNSNRVAATNSVNMNLTLKELKQLLKRQNKTTSSSPSGRHYGHYEC
eukprot:5947677-Ditylum_brightwellii.AAC.1